MLCDVMWCVGCCMGMSGGCRCFELGDSGD